jgi:hypothetical protein
LLDARDAHGRTPLDVALGVTAPGQSRLVRLNPVRERTPAALRQLLGQAGLE